jgi:hypothetical protein
MAHLLDIGLFILLAGAGAVLIAIAYRIATDWD